MTNSTKPPLAVVRGAGEMASGIIHRLALAGYTVVALETRAPDFVRRPVCFAEAVYNGNHTIACVTARFCANAEEMKAVLAGGDVPVIIDPLAESLSQIQPEIVIDARMEKKPIDCSQDMAPLVIGIGPGFSAEANCHLVIESQRGPDLGTVITEGEAQSYTGTPAPVNGHTRSRVLRAPVAGIVLPSVDIGDPVGAGATVCSIDEVPIQAEVSGVVRGMLRYGSSVITGQKIGDIDPRGDPVRCFRISAKARSIANGVMKALEFSRLPTR